MASSSYRQHHNRAEELTTKYNELTFEHNKLVGIEKRTSGQETRLGDVQRAMDKVTAELAEARQAEKDALIDDVKSGRTKPQPGTSFDGSPFSVSRNLDPWGSDDRTDTAHEMRGRASAAIEQWNADDALKESALETVARAGADADVVDAERDVRGVAGHIIRYSDPLYVSAFRKYSRDPETYVADLSADEARVWRAARTEQRAVLQTSGAVLPSPLDPTIVLTNDSAVDPMRSVARIDTTMANEKRYITSAGSSFSFDAELAEVSDDTHTETEVTLATEKAQGWIESSLEVWLDQPDFSSEVAKIIADAKARLEASSFVTGSGTNAPTGIQVALAGGASEVNAAGEALVADDVYGLIEALPPRFRQNATWQMELSTRNFIHRLHNPSGNEPPLIEGNQMIGLPFVLNSSIDPYSDVDASATANNYVLFVGDWSNYVILDRIGTSVYFVGPGHLRGSNDRPDGRVGWYSTWRSGAGALTIAAFRMLDVATTA